MNPYKDEMLVAFFYKLIRDSVPAGEVEKLVKGATQFPYFKCEYSNKHIEGYAREIVGRFNAIRKPFPSFKP